MYTDFITPPIVMPLWAAEIEKEFLGTRFGNDEAMLRFAIMLAVKNVQHRTGGPFGAAIFETASGKLAAIGLNLVTAANQSWAHAEMTACARLQHQLQRFRLDGYLLASSCEPCAMCSGAIPWSGVDKLIYGATGADAENTGFDEGDKCENWINSMNRRGIAVTGPLLTAEAAEPFRLYRQANGKIY